MSLNVNYTQNLKTGIDTTLLKEVSQEIIKRAQAKAMNVQNGTVNSAFKTQDIGLDLYQGKVDTQTARQIAMNNSGLQLQLNQNVLQSIQFLNTQAAQKLQKNVEGKLAFSVYEGQDTTKTTEMPKFNSIVSLGTNKDKNSSSFLYHGELLAKQGKKEEKTEEINIFG